MALSPSDEAEIPALLRAARASYAQALVARLAAAGIDDLAATAPTCSAGWPVGVERRAR
jgi:hypothetical protein